LQVGLADDGLRYGGGVPDDFRSLAEKEL